MNNTNQPQTPKGILKTITIIYYAYCAAILIFGIVALYITENVEIKIADSEDPFFYLVPVFAIAIAFLSHFLFQKNLKKTQEKSTLKEKLVQYQSARIIRYAMLEAPALLGIVIFIITSNPFYLLIAAIVLAYLVLLRPTKPILKEDLNLNIEQEPEFYEAMK
ncbi:hypothetical protein [Winogradskyella sp.]|uniref:hypothetical protein n=1 Tax=Winogradskyella sp. TaxID=1883156 RepID=UPI0025D475D5|nr:hypothetical protein [Winogradskyella sp.]